MRLWQREEAGSFRKLLPNARGMIPVLRGATCGGFGYEAVKLLGVRGVVEDRVVGLQDNGARTAFFGMLVERPAV
jgi:hypothetical protein